MLDAATGTDRCVDVAWALQKRLNRLRRNTLVIRCDVYRRQLANIAKGARTRCTYNHWSIDLSHIYSSNGQTLSNFTPLTLSERIARTPLFQSVVDLLCNLCTANSQQTPVEFKPKAHFTHTTVSKRQVNLLKCASSTRSFDLLSAWSVNAA